MIGQTAARVLAAICLLLSAALGTPQEIESAIEDMPDAPRENPDTDRTMGVLFSTSDILLEIAAFESGMGVTFWRPGDAVRVFVSGYASNASQVYSAELGSEWVNHIRNGRVSPYWTIGGSVGFTTQTAGVSADNWVRTTSTFASASAGLGVEVFLLEFLSVFAEYEIDAMMTRSQTVESIAGVTVPGTPTWTYAIQTELGNASRLGIAVYLSPVVQATWTDLAETSP